jgi:hypothetical protein
MLRSQIGAALADFDAEVEINSAWEIIRENINISAKEGLVMLLSRHQTVGQNRDNNIANRSFENV